jgi:glycosyltransferase involved in cell wall biosynthesis
MKVLMINVVCGVRSTGRICTDLATALEAQGHEVKIAYGREHVPERFRKYAVRIGTDFDVRLHGIRARVLDGAGFGSELATVKFIRWVKEYDPDVIHLHNIHGYYINIEILFAYLKTCGKRILWTLHDCWAFTGHSAYCDAVGCEKWMDGCGNCPQIKEYPRSITDHSQENWRKKRDLFCGIPNMTIVTPSKWLAELTQRSFLREYTVKVIHNGIDVSQFKPRKNNFRAEYHLEDRFILLGVATVWNDLKGYSDFISLSGMLENRYQIVLVGVTSEQMKMLPDHILGIERTASVKELTYIYSASDVFLNLTYCDSFGQVNVEAALCGTPVIAYDTGGCRESVSSNGYIVRQGDLEEVVNKIRLIEEKGFALHIDPLEYSTEKSIMEYENTYRMSEDERI